ncbi:MAG: MarR family transcriptional regulator [Clostridia bacterium]|nr:MarR family transcriptional regulator [Clostridia bacterium]
MQETSKQKEQLKRILFIYKKMEDVTRTDKNTPFNSTELQLLKELIFAKLENGRLISTQLAKRLGVTRSSVSQMVQKMEKQGILYRVPDEIDRKIAYIQMTPEAEELCRAELKKWTDGLVEIVKEFGEDKLENMLNLFDEFIQKGEEIRAKSQAL